MKVKGSAYIYIGTQAGNTVYRQAAVVREQGHENKRLWKSCQDLEGIFMGYLVKSLEQALPKADGSGSGMAQLMFTQVMGDALSQGGGIGMAEIIYRSLQSQVPPDSTDKGAGDHQQALDFPRPVNSVKK